MKQQVLDRLERLNRKLETAFSDLDRYPQEDLDRRPGDGQWSAMDALHHLRMAEGYAHRYVEKKLSFDPEIKKSGMGTAWRTFLMATFFRLPIKRQAPEAVNTPAFPEGVSLSRLRQEWIGQRQALYDYLNELDEHWFERDVYKHPFAGRLSLNGMLTFFDTHFDRHLKQARRAVRADK